MIHLKNPRGDITLNNKKQHSLLFIITLFILIFFISREMDIHNCLKIMSMVIILEK